VLVSNSAKFYYCFADYCKSIGPLQGEEGECYFQNSEDEFNL